MAELTLEQVFGGQTGDFARVGAQLGELRERIVGLLLLVGQAQGDRGHIGFDNGLGDAFVGDAGDDAGAAPLLHLGDGLLEIAGRDVEAPRAVDAGVAGDAVQQLAAEAARSFHQQGDFRDFAHRIHLPIESKRRIRSSHLQYIMLRLRNSSQMSGNGK